MIKKKSGWFINIAPGKPYLCPAPTKTIKKCITITSGCSVSLKEIEIPKEYLDQGYSLNDLIFTATSSYDDESEVLVELEVEIPNDQYKKQLLQHEKRKEIYKVELKVWEKDIKEWEAWKTQEEDKILQRQLEHAEKLLKRHNKL